MLTNHITFQRTYDILMNIRSLGIKKVKIGIKLVEVEDKQNHRLYWENEFIQRGEFVIDDIFGVYDLFEKLIFWEDDTENTIALKNKFININSKIESLRIEV